MSILPPDTGQTPIHVLLIDDEPQYMELTKYNLEAAGNSLVIEVINSPKDALNILQGNHFDCVVSDYQMPDMNGVEFCKQLRTFSNVPLIIYTGRGSEEVASAAYAAGANDYVRKEAELAHYRVLAKRITHLVENRRTEKRIKESDERFRSLFENIDYGLAIYNRDLIRIAANTAAEKILGVKKTDLENKYALSGSVVETYAEDGHLLTPDEFAINVVARTRAPVRNQVVKIVNNTTKEEHWLKVDVTPTLDDGGEVSQIYTIYEDITEKKLLEEENKRSKLALEDSERRYRQIVENATVGIYEVSIDGSRFIRANDATLKAVGYTREELLALRPIDIVDEESREKFIDRTRRVLSGEPIETPFEYRIRAKNGEMRWILLNDAEFIARGGKPESVVVIASDITDRKKAEDLLQEERDRLRSLVEGMQDEVWFADRNGKISFVNPSASKAFKLSTFGKKVEDIAGSLEVYKADGTPRKLEEAPPLRALRGEVISGEVEIVRASEGGDLRYRQVNASPVRGADGSIVGSVSVVRDITDLEKVKESLLAANQRLKDSEEHLVTSNEELRSSQRELQRYLANLESMVNERTTQLRATEQRLRSFLDSATDGFFLLDRDLKLLEINENARLSYLGANRREELIGKDLREITPGLERTDRYPLFMRVLETGVPETLTYRSPPLWGDAWVLLSAFKVGDWLGVITRNITKQIELEEKLREAKRGEDIEKISSMVAHDIRSPLNTASQALQMAKRDPSKSGQLTLMAEKSIDRAIEMIEQLRENTRRIEPRVSEVNLRLLIEDVIHEMPARDGVSMESMFGDGLERVAVDPSLTRRVLENLVLNAMESMASGGRVLVKSWRDGDKVLFSVTDTGAGIAEEFMGRVFEPLFTTKAKGVGLGLSFCRRAVEAQGGSIGFESRVGVGTTFTVRLPFNQL